MAHTIDTSDIDNGWGDDIPVTLEGFAPSADTVTQLSAMGRTEAGAHFLQTGKILLPTGADAAMAVENIYIQVCENDAQIGAIDDLLKTFNINDYTAVLEDGRVYVELPDSVRADFEKALRKGTQPKVADNSPSIEVSEETISHDEWLAMQIAEQDPFQNPEEVQGAVHGRIAGLYLE